MLSLNGKRQPRLDLRVGDALVRLREIPDASVHCCATSPPYFGLRDYGIDGQIGLEETPKEYVAKLVEVFREVRRVLRDDGTCWIVLGDSYSGSGGQNRNDVGYSGKLGCEDYTGPVSNVRNRKAWLELTNTKPKDLIGIPWLLAFALRDDGWYLRAEIIWHKLSCMPESVTDRPTRSHEQIFLFTKQANYFYDADAIREPITTAPQRRYAHSAPKDKGARQDRLPSMSYAYDGVPPGNPAGRNMRSVWTINPEPYRGAHFAVFPTQIPKRAILAGTSEYGACGTCGAPWTREVEVLGETRRQRQTTRGKSPYAESNPDNPQGLDSAGHHGNTPRQHIQRGWQASCSCPSATLVPCTVLDPFGGAGTTAYVALEQWRDCITIELNPDYAKIIEKRTWPLLSQQRFL